MRGEPIQAVNRGIQLLVKTLQNNPVALETVWVSIITFSTEAQQLVPLTEVSLLQVPKIQAGGRTAMGAALLLLNECAKSEVIRTTAERKGDWRPMVFFMSDGRPVTICRVLYGCFIRKMGIGGQCCCWKED